MKGKPVFSDKSYAEHTARDTELRQAHTSIPFRLQGTSPYKQLEMSLPFEDDQSSTAVMIPFNKE